MTTEAEIYAKHLPIIRALAEKLDSAKAFAMTAAAAYKRSRESLRLEKGGEAWIAYEAARAARIAAEAAWAAAHDACSADLKKLKAARRKAWFNR